MIKTIIPLPGQRYIAGGGIMLDTKEIKLKICLVGEGSVGKSSLIRRFVFDEFSDAYISTIGTKITKREVELKHPLKNEKFKVTLLIWDIMGQKGFRQLLQEAYFYGAQGLIAVCDITNKRSLKDLDSWIDSAFSVTGKVPLVFLANKSDLNNKAEFGLDDLKTFIAKYERSNALSSSAKTGENVEEAFKILGNEILKE
jgi:small GTP-binding protein